MPGTQIIITAGVPCSGKTTILKALQEAHPDIHIVNYAQMMLEEAARHDISRDQLRKLPIEEQQFYGEAAARRIAETARGTVVIDTHFLVKSLAGFIPGLPHEVFDILLPDAIVLVEASSQTILERRAMDTSRQRDVETVQEIERHQRASLAFAASCCALHGTPLTILDAEGKTPAEIAKGFDPLLKGQLAIQ